jgi:hypothetical protein
MRGECVVAHCIPQSIDIDSLMSNLDVHNEIFVDLAGRAMTKKIPASVTELDTEWFDTILGGVEDATVVKVIHGTATKICVDLRFKPPHEPAGRRVWVKTGMEPHSSDKRMDNVYAGEAFYYKNLAGKYDTRTPECFYAETDTEGHSVEEVAWRAYRAHAMHGIAWVMCPYEMQPEENCEVFTERFSTAAMDHGSVELILSGG